MIDIFEVFENYRLRYAQAIANLLPRRPWISKDRETILTILCENLGIRLTLAPTIKTQTLRRTQVEGFAIEHMGTVSWHNVVGAANLYLPSDVTGQIPVVLLVCGHENGCKTNAMYQRMAQRLASMGAAVLVTDNIGQGERLAMGHANCVAPFACGISVQGLIVMETMGWVQWLKCDTRFDPRRIAVIGHSGGGLLSMLIGALCPDVAAVVSSGYPSTFDYIALKEKKHCHCNILPRVVGQIEMWQVYGTIAPRPLFLFQGIHDNLFPIDIFHVTCRRVAWAYRQMEAEKCFHMAAISGVHAWDTAQISLVAEFLDKALGIDARKGATAGDTPLFDEEARNFDICPEEAIVTDTLARQLTGRNVPNDLNLWDVYAPDCETQNLPQVTERGETRQILAQFEAFLNNNK